ncbi:hypothetical protein M8J77_001905 [Diaphorina citri]|nr:hypothetical protein M8J77_001905 [Diaphorina citri]
MKTTRMMIRKVEEEEEMNEGEKEELNMDEAYKTYVQEEMEEEREEQKEVEEEVEEQEKEVEDEESKEEDKGKTNHNIIK